MTTHPDSSPPPSAAMIVAAVGLLLGVMAMPVVLYLLLAWAFDGNGGGR